MFKISYVAGAKPGKRRPVPADKTAQKRLAVHREYEVKQRKDRAFEESWREGRPWLEHAPGTGMTCAWCKVYYETPTGRGAPKSTFLTGEYILWYQKFNYSRFSHCHITDYGNS